MTRENAKHYMPLIQAWIEGKQLQKFEYGRWHDFTPDAELSWKFPYQSYRIKPEPKLRPWKSQEVPVGALLRNRHGLKTMILWANNNRFGWLSGRESCLSKLGGESDVCFEDALTYTEKLEYSVDNGKTWLPCGVMEE